MASCRIADVRWAGISQLPAAMKVIDKSEFRNADGNIGIQNRLQGTLRFGAGGYGMTQAQTLLTQRLSRTLSGEFAMMRNYVIPGSPTRCR